MYVLILSLMCVNIQQLYAMEKEIIKTWKDLKASLRSGNLSHNAVVLKPQVFIDIMHNKNIRVDSKTIFDTLIKLQKNDYKKYTNLAKKLCLLAQPIPRIIETDKQSYELKAQLLCEQREIVRLNIIQSLFEIAIQYQNEEDLLKNMYIVQLTKQLQEAEHTLNMKEFECECLKSKLAIDHKKSKDLSDKLGQIDDFL